MATLNIENLKADLTLATHFPVVDVSIFNLFKECTPKILVVTDSLSFTTSDFGLSDFVNTLKTSTIHGMTPIVETALHQTGGTADHPNFFFTSASLSKSTYDVLFLFGSNGPTLNSTEVGVIEDFMDAGGGVFGTGDHSLLGKPLCGDIKRLKEMRRWDGPSASSDQRLSTNDPGANNVFDFADQSDSIPQKIYPAYTGTPSSSEPHALLQHPSKGIIEVLPDHPHESECLVPASVSDSSIWPYDSLSNEVSPQLVALSVSYGGGISTHSKQPISEPRCFGAIGAYDGHETDDGVGRIAVDATWHHFININLIASSSGTGIAANADAYDRINTYFRNIAEWLMPKNVRKCLRWPILISIRDFYPIGEFLMEAESKELDLDTALELGRELRSTLRRFLSAAKVSEFEDDLIELANPRLKYRLRSLRDSKKLKDAITKDFATEDLYRLTSAGAAIYTVSKLLHRSEDLTSTFKKIDGAKGLEAHCKAHIDLCFKSLNSELARGRAALDELLEAFN